MTCAASMTVASVHPAALAVHSGIVTDKPRPEDAVEMDRRGASIGTLAMCCSGTVATGPNSNGPPLTRGSLAISSASVRPPSNPRSKAMSASALPFSAVLNQLSPEERPPGRDRVLGSKPHTVTWSPDSSTAPTLRNPGNLPNPVLPPPAAKCSLGSDRSLPGSRTPPVTCSSPTCTHPDPGVAGPGRQLCLLHPP